MVRVAVQMLGIHEGGSGCDTLPPIVTLTSPEQSATYVLNEVVPAEYSCDDGLGSGVTSCAGSTPSGQTLNTSSPGLHSFTVMTTDAAGNAVSQTHTYRVVYRFTGLFAPVDNLPVANRAQSGSTIPIKWRITDANGVPISNPESFLSANVVAKACDANPVEDAVEEAVSNSGLTYLGDGRWLYTWQTADSYAESCRLLQLTLADGVGERDALFRFR